MLQKRSDLEEDTVEDPRSIVPYMGPMLIRVSPKHSQVDVNWNGKYNHCRYAELKGRNFRQRNNIVFCVEKSKNLRNIAFLKTDTFLLFSDQNKFTLEKL